MSAPQSHNHHYVPQWYQRRFLPSKQSKLYYLDLKPQRVTNGDSSYLRRNPKKSGVVSCFCEEDLYSIRFGKQMTDMLETRLFGVVDKKGAAAAEFFRNYDDYIAGTHEAYQDLLTHMGAQRFRTPHGLDWIKKRFGLQDHSRALLVMNDLFQAYLTMWMEGVWEIAHARQSNLKFIISDDPVTLFNRRVIPGGEPYPGGADVAQAGSRTIFPLSMDSCLIITHLQLARNPWNNPTEDRENARTFNHTIAKLTDIQFGRELNEAEVLRVNLILKRSATRFIAAAHEEALYPERHVDTHWTQLDQDWFLLPNICKVRFSAGIYVGYKDGTAWGMDEYGRTPAHPLYEDEERRQFEHRRFESSKLEWAKRRLGKSLARVVDQMHEDTLGDMSMNRYLRQAGLLPPEED
jgi:Protein of unknown function (DUF4238)